MKLACPLMSLFLLSGFAAEKKEEPKLQPKIKLEKSQLRAKTFDVNDFIKKTGSLVPKLKEDSFTGTQGDLSYRFFEPKDLMKGKKVPLVIFLHGFGDQNSNHEWVQLRHPQCLVFVDPDNQKKTPCFFLAPRLNNSYPYWGGAKVSYPEGLPQLPVYRQSEPTAPQQTLAELIIDKMKKHPEIDPERIYLTGLSSGGAGCFAMVENFPHHFAAIMPICCGSEKTLDLCQTRQKIGIWAFYNKNEEEESRRCCGLLCDRYKAWGGDVSLSTFEDSGVGGHSAWNWAFAEPKLIPWMFSQKRAKAPVGTKLLW